MTKKVKTETSLWEKVIRWSKVIGAGATILSILVTVNLFMYNKTILLTKTITKNTETNLQLSNAVNKLVKAVDNINKSDNKQDLGIANNTTHIHYLRKTQASTKKEFDELRGDIKKLTGAVNTRFVMLSSKKVIAEQRCDN